MAGPDPTPRQADDLPFVPPLRRAPAPISIPRTRWPDAREARDARLFSPVRIGPITARRRTWVPAMVPWRASEHGEVTGALLDWYGRFAAGRPGVLVVEATGIRDVPSGPLLRIDDDAAIEGLGRLVREVRERSAGETRLFIQLIDFLPIHRRPTRERFLARYLELTAAHRAAVGLGDGAPGDAVRSALAALPEEELRRALTRREWEDMEWGKRVRVTDVHLDEVRSLPAILPERFAAAAERAQRAGFDGIELHFAHAYTMASFLSRTNTRGDGYGSTLEGRVRLPLEVLDTVRSRVGDGLAVGCRFLGDEAIEGGSDLSDAVWFAERFARAGMDFLSVSRGGKFDDAAQPKVGEAAYPYTGPSGLACMPTVRIERGPFGLNLGLSRAIRARVRAAGFETPVIGCGGISTFELAEAALARGELDIVASARQSLADPDWFRKLELGRGDEIRRCKFTNYCEALDQRHLEVTCQLWDRDFERPDCRPAACIQRTADGKRRRTAPAWPGPEER